MIATYHKLRPTNPLDIQKDYHALYITAHATYNFDPGLSVRTDITLFLYTKTILNFHRPESKVHQQFIHDGLTAKDIGCFGLTEIGHGSDTKNL
jgi:alkylation response protein AidB-like acyl-CoA dehydrogenase